MLPFVYARRTYGARAQYWHEAGAEALNEFVGKLDRGSRSYDEALRRFGLDLYASVAGDARWFLDKTPHYHLIIEDLGRVFPEARFVFLWRHPLAVASSLLETFCDGAFEPHSFELDLFDGVSNLCHAWNRRDERAIAVRYEDLLTGGDAAWIPIFDHLGLEYDGTVLERFHEVDATGGYGDPTGSRRYQELSQEPLGKWLHSFRSPVRRAWAACYLRWIGAAQLELMGYDIAALQRELSAVPRAATAAETVRDATSLVSSYALRRVRSRALAVAEMPPPRGAAF